MSLGDPYVLEMIRINALKNCTSKPLHTLLQKNKKPPSLYTTQWPHMFAEKWEAAIPVHNPCSALAKKQFISVYFAF